MSALAHEHFCSRCYGHKTNGVCSGWWRCTLKPCTKLRSAPCRKHQPDEARWLAGVSLLALTLLASACGHFGNPATRARVPAPVPPQRPAEAVRIDTVTPTDVTALGLCDPVTSWNSNRWFSVDIDGARQAFSGPLVPDTAAGPNCYTTQKVFKFSAGTHAVTVALINHCDAGDADPLCKTGCKDATGAAVACVGDAPGPPTALTVISTAAQPTCTYTLSAPEQSFQAAGGSGNVAITTTAPCQWTASSSASWVTVTPPLSLTGPGSVTFVVAGNTAGSRSGVLTLAGQAFTVRQAGVPVLDCTGAIVLAVGDWTRSGRPGDSGRVFYSLTKSRSSVTRVAVSVDGVEVPPIPQGTTDLRQFLGSYFTFPKTPGTHRLTVSAKDATGCEDGSSRPMTITVK